jgi:hypothetical protein
MSEKGLEPDIRSRRGNVAEVPKADIRCADLAAAFDSSIMAAQRCISGGINLPRIEALAVAAVMILPPRYSDRS